MSPGINSWRFSRTRSNSTRSESQIVLDPRWGDQAITSPTDGGWNHLNSGSKLPTPEVGVGSWASPASTLVNSSPEVGFEEKSQPKRSSLGSDSRHAITIKIPIPWSRKSNKRSNSLPRSASEEPTPISPETRVASATTPIYTLSGHAFTPVLVPAYHFDPSGKIVSPVDQNIAARVLTVNSPPALHILTPVAEDFGRKTATGSQDVSPVVTSIENSPSTSIKPPKLTTDLAPPTGKRGSGRIDPSPIRSATRDSSCERHERGITRIPTHPAHSGKRSRSTSRNNSHKQPGSRGPGLNSTSYMRSPSLDGTFSFQQPRFLDSTRRRSREPNVRRHSSKEATSRRALSSDPPSRNEKPRPHSGSSQNSSSTDVPSDSESELDPRAGDIYFQTRKMWNGTAGGGANGFYADVKQDYKKIAKDVETEYLYKPAISTQNTDSRRKDLDQEFDMLEELRTKWKISDKQVPAVVGKQTLVPTSEELWG